MRYAATILYVPSVREAIDWYGRAFGLLLGRGDPEGGYAELAGDGGRIAFASLEVAPESGPAGGFELWLETPDVHAAFDAAVAAGATPVEAPVKRPWGQTVAYVRDPNGVLVELGEPVDM